MGHYGADVERLYRIYRDQMKLTRVEIKLYDGLRHELQQEIGRRQVFEDQAAWIMKIAG